MFRLQTDPGLYLLITFHNLSAPHTVDCTGAFIEIERDNNGYEARWCGNKIGQVNIYICQTESLSFVISNHSRVRTIQITRRL